MPRLISRPRPWFPHDPCPSTAGRRRSTIGPIAGASEIARAAPLRHVRAPIHSPYHHSSSWAGARSSRRTFRAAQPAKRGPTVAVLRVIGGHRRHTGRESCGTWSSRESGAYAPHAQIRAISEPLDMRFLRFRLMMRFLSTRPIPAFLAMRLSADTSSPSLRLARGKHSEGALKETSSLSRLSKRDRRPSLWPATAEPAVL